MKEIELNNKSEGSQDEMSPQLSDNSAKKPESGHEKK